MIETSDLLAFTRVIELASLTRAAHALGVPKSTISRRLSRLEEELGAPLLRRTTHGVSATEQGATFFQYASRCLGLMRDGTAAVQTQHDRPRGLLRLAVPPELDRDLLAPALAAYLERYPDVRLVTGVASGGDPFRAGFDLAIVADVLPQAEATLVSTALGSAATGLYAAPAYLERTGMPQRHQDIARFDVLAWGGAGRRTGWRLTRGDEAAEVGFLPRLTCDDLALLRRAVLSGLGIAVLTTSGARDHLAAGTLVRVLPDWTPPPRRLFAVFPKAQAMPVRVRAMIDLLAERLRPALSSPAAP